MSKLFKLVDKKELKVYKKIMNSKVLSTNEIRKKWLDFFQQKGYHLIEPASLIPHNDPSLL